MVVLPKSPRALRTMSLGFSAGRYIAPTVALAIDTQSHSVPCICPQYRRETFTVAVDQGAARFGTKEMEPVKPLGCSYQHLARSGFKLRRVLKVGSGELSLVCRKGLFLLQDRCVVKLWAIRINASSRGLWRLVGPALPHTYPQALWKITIS